MQAQCSIPECMGRPVGRGWCRNHYDRWRRNGGPTIKLRNYVVGTPEERFWTKVDPCRTDGCALWLGSTTKNGYGKFGLGSKVILAHTFLIGKAPIGLGWDHVRERGCTHRACVWPGHLELVTRLENINRGAKARPNLAKTHCPQGHAYEGENLYVNPKTGRRHCRTCRLAWDRAKRLA